MFPSLIVLLTLLVSFGHAGPALDCLRETAGAPAYDTGRAFDRSPSRKDLPVAGTTGRKNPDHVFPLSARPSNTRTAISTTITFGQVYGGASSLGGVGAAMPFLKATFGAFLGVAMAGLFVVSVAALMVQGGYETYRAVRKVF